MGKTIECFCATPGQTAELAHAFAASLHPGDLVSLEGDLGSGKTFFTREVARALGVREHVTSPTFVLEKRYELTQNPAALTMLVHYDVYRLDSYSELLDIGFEELPEGAVAFIEWGDRFAGELSPVSVRVRFHIGGDEQRRIIIECDTERAKNLLARLACTSVACRDR